jgi:hypothetical protein
MDVARRLKVGLAALVALMGCAFFATPALADTQPDPTESNIPYLAWRGEQVRLVKCAPAITGVNQRADFLLVDWSGEENSLAIPQMEGSTAGFFVATGKDHAGQGCVGGTFTSQKAGIAQIKLVVSSLPGGVGSTVPAPGGVGFLPGGHVVGLAGTPILKHDFLAAWMNLNTPVLSVGNPPGPLGDVPASGFPTPGADVLTDPAGAGPNNFRVDVTGNIPLRADFRELGLGDTLQMPRDWPRLAVAMGTYFNPDNPAPGGLWDIHDNRATDEGHGFQSICPPYSTGTAAVAERAAKFDAVDNCPQLLNPNGTMAAAGTIPNPALFPNSGSPLTGEFGAFSRIWSGAATPAIGPFDPLKPSETLLSNGVLDANDAPMPAARIDFTTTGGGFFGCNSAPGARGVTVAGPGGVSCDTITGPNGFIARTPTGALFFLPAGTIAPGFSCPGQNATNLVGWICVPLGPALLPNQRAKDKHVIYSRNGTGAITAATPNEHNLYAPFYGRFIPATARASAFACTTLTPTPAPTGCDPRLPSNFVPNAEASGEDGPSGSVLDNTAPTGPGCGTGSSGPNCPNIGTNDFNGWLVNGLYHYWDIARVLNNAAVAPSTCLLRFVTSFTPNTIGGLNVTRVPFARPLPSGPQTVAVYTDEHGEAHVNWFPGVGFPFAGLASNLNAGCDVTGNLATPVVQAIARYPYQPVTAPPLLSNTFTKTVTSLFAKTLLCAPKGTGVNDQFSQICVISARDITGSPVPFAGEIVCFASNAELIQHFHNEVGSGLPVLPASLGGGTVNGTLLSPAEVAALGKSGAAVLCQRLDANGRAAVEVFGKGPSNVLVDLVDEGLIRALTFNFGPPTSATGTSEAVSSNAAATPAQVAAVNNSTGTTVVLPSGNITNQPGSKPEVTPGAKVPGTKAAPKYTMAFSPQLISPANGRPYLKVRVNGPKGNVKIQIAYIGAKKTVKTFKRTIATNKVVLVKNMPKISAAVRSYRVTIAG